MLWSGGYLLRFYGKDCKTGLAKIITHLTNSSPSKKRFSNRPIRFPGSNLDSGEITGNVNGSARSKDLTAWARGLSPTSTTRSDAPCRWRARRPLASRVWHDRVQTESQIATVDSSFDLVGSLQHGVASCEVCSWLTDIHKPTKCRWWWPQMKLKSKSLPIGQCHMQNACNNLAWACDSIENPVRGQW